MSDADNETGWKKLNYWKGSLKHRLTASDYRIILYIAERMDEDGILQTSIDRLSAIGDITQRHVKTRLSCLEKEKIIEIIHINRDELLIWLKKFFFHGDSPPEIEKPPELFLRLRGNR